LSFSGDAEDEPVDMFAEAEKAAEQEEEEEDPDAEPEDDFNAAWEVLDLARAIFEKQKDEDDMAKLKLADTYMCLGDVSLETGQFVFPTRSFGV
jgi:HAT1-interacting factor 1